MNMRNDSASFPGDENRVDEVKIAVQRLVDEKKKDNRDFSEKERHLLSHLLSQMESMLKDKDGNTSNEVMEGCGGKEVDEMEEIVSELKKLRIQNVTTHFLLSVLVVITTVWQLSEVSALLIIKSKLAQPFRCIGRLVSSLVFGGKSTMDHILPQKSVDQLQLSSY